MAYVVKDVITPEGVAKKQFYNLVGMQDINDQTVEVQVWNGEFSAAELNTTKDQVQLQMDDIDLKLSYFA